MSLQDYDAYSKTFTENKQWSHVGYSTDGIYHFSTHEVNTTPIQCSYMYTGNIVIHLYRILLHTY